jgi:hypothetical protein
MLFFSFSSFQEFRARKNSAEFITIINNGFSVINKMRAERGAKRIQTFEQRAKSAERKAFVKNVNARIFTAERAVSAMRAELQDNPDKYTRLNLNAKEVTRAHLIVINDSVYTLRAVTTIRANWELQSVKNVTDVMRSLEQKSKLIQLVTRQMERGEIPTENPRAYVARLIKGE